MKRVALIQARLTSSRLPAKVLSDLEGKPMLFRQVERLQRCRRLDEIWVATTEDPSDDPLVDACRAAGIPVHRGSLPDVLLRLVGAARAAGAEVIVRLTADCPLVDPEITDQVLAELIDHAACCDYASNVGLTTAWSAGSDGQVSTRPLERTYPRGLDVEVMFRDVLERMHRLSRSPQSREHVTVLPRSERPDLFLIRTVRDTEDNSDLRWTVDTPEDLALVRRLYRDLDLAASPRSYREILAHVRAHPELATLNLGAETVTG